MDVNSCRTMINGIKWAVLFLWACSCRSQEIPACESEIYCNGTLLDTIQRARLFPDSKTFVDMSLKDSPENVIAAFNKLNDKSTQSLRAFVQTHFSGPGDEIEPWTPTDYVKNPSFLNAVNDSNLRAFGRDLCGKWKDLGRKIKEDVRLHPDRYSLLYLPHPFIVPGGRFRETYYWDTYWVIKGLLVCEMYTTVKGMLENFITMIKSYGLIPNGGRIYYTRRSQPPLFIPMVWEYYKATDDLTFIRNNIEYLEMEYNFWITNRSIPVMNNKYSLNRYASVINTPRPESYAEDVEIAERSDTDDNRQLYSNIASAAESGWDFSSRWFSREAGQTLTLETIRTRDIVPVDLNSILCMNEKILAQLYYYLDKGEKQSQYLHRSKRRSQAIDKVFWNDDKGIWQDYSNGTHRDYFYASNIFPMFADCMPEDSASKKEKERNVITYLKNEKVFDYKGGVPTSLDSSGQQWDFPNAWPPLQHIMIWALSNGRLDESKLLASNLTQLWIESNWMGWNRTGNMFEKYLVNEPGFRGGGGEYDVQEGFGWTNGVILDILKQFGSTLKLDIAPQMEHYDNTSLPCEPNSSGKGTTNDSSLVLPKLFQLCVILSSVVLILGYKV